MQDNKTISSKSYLYGLIIVIAIVASVVGFLVYQEPQRKGLRECLKLVDENWKSSNQMYEFLQKSPSSKPEINNMFKYPPNKRSFDQQKVECYETFKN